ncbi:MAG: CO dehydrogenase/CO-methylating acetyl-CoA synthase complex subunit beta [Candidatus Atribacteria bacterium]|nr:MAG: CO dehydrogenase/CO-methylating acetyl-CoA synthase complex subunit beta [Candidatus Atribacteria bacterium]
MSKIIAELAIRGACDLVNQARRAITTATARHGATHALGFPDTAYALPLTLALTGLSVDSLQVASEAMTQAEALLPAQALGDSLVPVLEAGRAALIAEEILEALRLSALGETSETSGFPGDSILRSQGIKLVDGRMPGVAACVGAPPTAEQAVAIARALQGRNILAFLSSSTAGQSMTAQLTSEGIEANWDTFLVPLGSRTSATVHALGFAARAAMMFGGIKPDGGAATQKILDYCKERVFAFVLALGSDDLTSDEGLSQACAKLATVAGALNFGFPTITDADIPQILAPGICTYEAIVSGIPIDGIVQRAIEVRGLKLEVTEIPIPVAYGAGFEGERVRKAQMHAEFGGNRTDAFELLRGKPMDDVMDGQIELIGPDIDDITPGDALPFGVLVDVAGREFKEAFESVLERRIHEFASWANGVFHMGQRGTVWARISHDAYAQGFRLRHYGEVLIAKLHSEFGAILNKVQVTILTEPGLVASHLAEAKTIYRERDERIQGMQDEDTDTFYSCTLCQSYAPNHVCIVTPERPGLCGAYTWLDCAASYEMNPHGPNQPVPKSETLDPVKGQWKGVNDFLAVASNGALERYNAYSLMDDPMTSCGCFECITAIVPEVHGVMIVDREFPGMTPVGMTFSTMAGEIGGGIQTPGFLGVGKLYIGSKKFISAEGGLKRVVWMPSALKEELRDRLQERADNAGIPDLLDRIATELDATTAEELVVFLESVSHPALTMESLF